MGKSMTRAAIIWFVGAAVVGAIAGGLHVLRSEIGGAHQGLPLAVSAYVLSVLAAAMLFHGVMVAAREQDAAAPAPEPEPVAGRDPVEGAPEVTGPAVDAPAVYTFRGGKPVGDRSQRPARRDRSPRS